MNYVICALNTILSVNSIHACRVGACRAGNSLICSSLIRSFCSNQMSDCERFAKIAQDKSATVSESLRSLRSLKTNEWPWANRSCRSSKMSDVSKSLRSLTKNERMSESFVFLSKSLIRSFFRKTRAIRSENQWANSQPLVHVTWAANSRVVFYSYALMAVSTWDGVDNMNGGGWLVTRAGSTKDELIRRVNSSWSG